MKKTFYSLSILIWINFALSFISFRIYKEEPENGLAILGYFTTGAMTPLFAGLAFVLVVTIAIRIIIYKQFFYLTVLLMNVTYIFIYIFYIYNEYGEILNR